MYIGTPNDEQPGGQERLEHPTRGIQAENQHYDHSIQYSKTGSCSSTEENEQERTDREVGEGTRRGRGGTASSIGKMLRQLRTIKEAHLAYVKAHEQRLETRLDENRKHQEQVFSEIEQLENELTQLLNEPSSAE